MPLAIAGRIGQPGLDESAPPQPAGIAAAAGAARLIGLITRDGLGIVDSETRPLADDPGLAELDQRRVDGARTALDPCARGEAGEPREGGDEFRPAVRIAARVEH